MSNEYDLIVIGSGPGGYVAAIRASQLGMKTAIVETRASGRRLSELGLYSDQGATADCRDLSQFPAGQELRAEAEKVSFDLEAVVKRSRGIANQLSGGVKHLMKKNKITVIDGDARLEKGSPAPTVIVKDKDGKDTTYKAKHVILATGAPGADRSPGRASTGRQVHLDRQGSHGSG